jgi:cation transport protein ChaC
MWVFGYGSLIWNPGFDYEEHVIATLADHHRSFCIRSISARGTPDKSGLGLALTRMPGAICQGVAFSIAHQNAGTTLAYLRDRELASAVYLETTLDVSLLDGRVVPALTYVANTNHEQFVAGLSDEEQAQRIARAAGALGTNSEYLFSTAENLDALGIADARMSQLAQNVRAISQRDRSRS